VKEAWRKRNAQSLYEAHYGPNMTPMVDVVMVILIFFMASTAFLGPEWFLKTNLPVRGTPPAGAPEPTRVTVGLSISDEGQTLVSIGAVAGLAMTELEARIVEQANASGPDNLVVMVSPGPGVPYEDVVQVHEVCARAGIAKVGLVEPQAPDSAAPL
jgi:biopolymer transport protein ExbD